MSMWPSGALSQRSPTIVLHPLHAKSCRKLSTTALAFNSQCISGNLCNIPVLYLRARSRLMDVSSAVEAIIVCEDGIDRAKVGVSNAIPRISETTQLHLAFEAAADDYLHDGTFRRGAL